MTCSLEYEDLDSGLSLWQPALEWGQSPGSGTSNDQIIPLSLWPVIVMPVIISLCEPKKIM